MHSLLVASLLFGSGADDPVSRDQLIRILSEASSNLKDVEFIYEGRIRRLGADPHPNDHDEDFQGTFAYRSDKSAHTDLYVQGRDLKNPLVRRMGVLFRGQYGQRSRTPDAGRIAGIRDLWSNGAIATLNEPESALRFLILPRLMELLADLDHPFRFVGWEMVGKHRCLKIEITNRSGSHGERYWIDSNRGGNPLRCEEFLKSEVRGRDFDIELAKFTTDGGGVVWLPIQGKSHSFVDVKGISNSPIFEETYEIVGDTIKLNQGLKDERFSLDWSAKASTPVLANQQQEFERSVAKARKPKSAQQVADEQLAEAERQAKALEASSPARETWSWVGATQILAFLSAVAFIGTGVILRRRAR